MSRRFVIGVEGLTVEQENEFRAYIRQFGPRWHWIGNLWLLVTEDTVEITAKQIQQKIGEISRGARRIVFEFKEDITWSGSGRANASGKNMFEWIRTAWGPDES
jgi:hypothetical protein